MCYKNKKREEGEKRGWHGAVNMLHGSQSRDSVALMRRVCAEVFAAAAAAVAAAATALPLGPVIFHGRLAVGDGPS